MNNNISLLSAFWSMMLRDRRPITPNTDIGGDFNNWLGAPVLLEADDIRCLVGPGGYLRDREGPLVLRPIFCRHLGAVLSFTYWCEDLKWIHSFPFPAEGDFLRYDSTGYTKIMLKIYKKRKLRKNLLWIKLRDGGTAHSPGKSPGSFWAPSCVAVGIPHIDIRIVRLPSSLKRRVCQAENTIKQASCQKKTHSGCRIYRYTCIFWKRWWFYLYPSSPLEPRCCRLRCTCQSLWGYERSVIPVPV